LRRLSGDLGAGTVDVFTSNRTGGRAWSELSAQLGQARFFLKMPLVLPAIVVAVLVLAAGLNVRG
jgi:hypothetical protein